MLSFPVMHTDDLFSDHPENSHAAGQPNGAAREKGQFFTPWPVARFMAAWVTADPSCTRLCDPAAGLGVFFRVAHSLHPQRAFSFTGYETDSALIPQAVDLLNALPDCHAEMRCADFLAEPWDEQFDGILCNPPYLHFRRYAARVERIAVFRQHLQVDLSNLANLYALFLLKGLRQLAPHGRAAFIIPAELLNADFGVTIKQALLDDGRLRHILVFNPAERLFAGALTTSCILLFAPADGPEGVTFSQVDSLDALQNWSPQFAAPLADLNPRHKWLAHLTPEADFDTANFAPLNAYAHARRGIATGDNRFFLLNLEDIHRWGLSPDDFLPCLTHAAQADVSCFTSADWENLVTAGQRVFLLNPAALHSTALQAYLQHGQSCGVAERFLPAHRRLWYAPENRPPAPLLVTVFNRRRLRFIINQTGVRNLTCFHGIYPLAGAANYFDLLAAYLLTPTALRLVQRQSRLYSEGMFKLEPNDINHTLVPRVEQLPAGTQAHLRSLLRQLCTLHHHGGDSAPLILQMDQIFQEFTNAG